MNQWVSVVSSWILPVLILLIPGYALLRKVDVFASFVEGAQEGFTTSVQIIPFLVGMLVAIAMFRASGAMDLLVQALYPLTSELGVPQPVLPLLVMRPLTGTGALGMAVDIMRSYGPDSMLSRMAMTVQGSADTTFYIAAVYFGAVGIRKVRYSILAGLAADVAGFFAAVWICQVIFA